jgi:hypothetical protein
MRRNLLQGGLCYLMEDVDVVVKNKFPKDKKISPEAQKLRGFLFTLGAYVDKLLTFNQRIVGSNPIGSTKSKALIAQLVE